MIGIPLAEDGSEQTTIKDYIVTLRNEVKLDVLNSTESTISAMSQASQSSGDNIANKVGVT